MTTNEIAKLMDISAVRADSTMEEIKESAELAKQYGCICVFALPAHTQYLISQLGGSTVFAGGAVGFPGGAETTATKVAIAKEMVAMGCQEVDMVNNIAWLKANNKVAYVNDVRSVVQAAGGKPLKVILECHWLTSEEIVRACEWSVEAGAAWVKTGTGWAPTGATLENVTLMKQTVGERCQVKAAGGVKDLETLLAMHERGVRRFGIGVRTARAILEGAPASSDLY
jgi:deoxyribose-phosphate aldolase